MPWLAAAFQVLRGGDGAVAGDRRGVLGNICLADELVYKLNFFIFA